MKSVVRIGEARAGGSGPEIKPVAEWLYAWIRQPLEMFRTASYPPGFRHLARDASSRRAGMDARRRCFADGQACH